MYDTILVPTDGSEVSMRAAREAFDLAHEFDSTVHVLYVVDESAGTMLLSGSRMATVLEELEEKGAAAVAEVAELSDDVEVRTDVVRGTRVGTAILDYARGNDVDLVVMGSHGMGGLERLLGSTTQRVLVDSGCPVLVVEPDDGGA